MHFIARVTETTGQNSWRQLEMQDQVCALEAVGVYASTCHYKCINNMRLWVREQDMTDVVLTARCEILKEDLTSPDCVPSGPGGNAFGLNI